jgi:hypothetical protein
VLALIQNRPNQSIGVCVREFQIRICLLSVIPVERGGGVVELAQLLVSGSKYNSESDINAPAISHGYLTGRMEGDSTSLQSDCLWPILLKKSVFQLT